MSITFYTVDVGHGLCQVIRFGERAILIDGGGAVGKRVAEEFLKRYVRIIVAYIATHNDADHVGAAPELLDYYASAATLHTIWLLMDRPAKSRDQSDEDVIGLLGYSRRRELAKTIQKRHALYANDREECTVIHHEPSQNAELQLLYPRALDTSGALIRGNPDAAATNQVSAILRLVVGDPQGKACALITGDANCESFRIARHLCGRDLRARVLSVPHHGGKVPAPVGSPDWNGVVDWIAPEIAVVSAGLGRGVPQTTTTKRATFDPLRKATICCTQITRHCHPQYLDLSPSVRPLANSPMPQMSGRRDYPDAVACAGTIAIKVNAEGEVKFAGRDQHRSAVDQKVAPAPGCPHCR